MAHMSTEALEFEQRKAENLFWQTNGEEFNRVGIAEDTKSHSTWWAIRQGTKGALLRLKDAVKREVG